MPPTSGYCRIINRYLPMSTLSQIHFLIPRSSISRGKNDDMPVAKEKFEDMLTSEENHYFIVKDLTALSLIQNAFLNHFVKSGSLTAVSHNSRVEVDNFLSIISPGKLVLSLEKSISRSLALQKENPHKKKRGRNFETIIIDLTCPEFFPGKKNYEFISFELSKINHIKFTVLLKWKPEGDVCCHSLKAYFLSQGYECNAYEPIHNYKFKRSISVPAMNFDPFDTSICTDILEWVGAHICGIEYSTTENEYVSKFTIPEHSKALNMLHTYSFEGFYLKAEVLPVIKEIRNIIEGDCSIPYAVICVSGFQDSYIVANGFQHFSSEDKLICVILIPSSDSFIITLNAR